MKRGFILVDVPEKCNRCRFWFGKATMPVEYRCMAEQRKLESIDKKPDWCPIQELPDKKEPHKLTVSPLVKEQYDGFGRGWNACRDHILGKKEGEKDE